jgi:hypothetical protein
MALFKNRQPASNPLESWVVEGCDPQDGSALVWKFRYRSQAERMIHKQLANDIGDLTLFKVEIVQQYM